MSAFQLSLLSIMLNILLAYGLFWVHGEIVRTQEMIKSSDTQPPTQQEDPATDVSEIQESV